MKQAIFKDPQLQRQFDERGYLKINLLEKDLVEQLAHQQKEYFPDDSDYFFSSSYLNDFDKKQKISNEIVSQIAPSLNHFFQNFRSIGAAFLIKGTGPKSEMPMHQDWSIVDEDHFYALNVWIPLMDTKEENGTLEVMEGSHLWAKAKRAPTLPFPFEGHQEKIKSHLKAIPCSAGEVIVLNQALIHYSKPNFSKELRPAITLGIVTKEASLSLHYFDKDNPGQLEKFEQEDDFLLKFENFHQSIFERPKIGNSIGHINYQVPQISACEIDRLLGIKKVKKNFFQRLFAS